MAPLPKVLSGQQFGNQETNPTEDTRRVLSQAFPTRNIRDLTIRITSWLRFRQVHYEFRSNLAAYVEMIRIHK